MKFVKIDITALRMFFMHWLPSWNGRQILNKVSDRKLELTKILSHRKKLIIIILFFQVITTLSAQIDCPQGYVERNVKCDDKIVVKCVPENYYCNKCWRLEFAPCPGSKSGGSWFYSSYENALEAAKKESNNWHEGKCTWYDNTKYKIYLDDSKYCSTTPNDSIALKNDLLNKIQPFLSRYMDEITNYRKGQMYNPGAVFNEYEDQLEQAYENALNLKIMLNNINDHNLSKIESDFIKLQQEEKTLKQAYENFGNKLNGAKQQEENKQNIDETDKQKELQLQQRSMQELSIKSQAQADIAKSFVEAIGTIFSSIQANQVKKNIAEDNRKREKHFELLKRQIQNEQGELIDCISCNGEGYTSCKSCDSIGKKTCGVCYGKAGETCSVCKGSGTYQVGTMSLTCTSCLGKGVISCTYCGNIGETLCVTCNGLGKIQCSHCFGTGEEFKRNFSNQNKSQIKN